jgi:hypothetical protein
VTVVVAVALQFISVASSSSWIPLFIGRSIEIHD